MQLWRHDEIFPADATLRHRHIILSETRLRSGLLSLPPNQTVPAHRHTDSDEIFFIISGTGHFWGAGDVSEVRSGDVVHVPAGESHAILAGSSEPLVFLTAVAPNRDDAELLPDIEPFQSA
jgi:quercetin dioxygenase-like cupin family protein